jgi:hypothetical protein
MNVLTEEQYKKLWKWLRKGHYEYIDPIFQLRRMLKYITFEYLSEDETIEIYLYLNKVKTIYDPYIRMCLWDRFLYISNLKEFEANNLKSEIKSIKCLEALSK